MNITPIVRGFMDKSFITLASMFFNHVFRKLLVVENEHLVGQITRRDLLRTIQRIKLPK